MMGDPARALVSLVDTLREHKDTLLRGVTLFIGGFALIVAGSLIGVGSGKLAEVAAGTIAITGVIVAFLGFFVYILPPLLPAK